MSNVMTEDMRERKYAEEFYDSGIPSCLPDSNKHKRAVEEHRWGKHTFLRQRTEGDRTPLDQRIPAEFGECPICDRGYGRSELNFNMKEQGND